MIPLKAAFGRLSGLSLSLVIHGAVAGIACVTLIHLPSRGGGEGGGGGDGLSKSFSVGVHVEESRMDGEREVDAARYGRAEPEASPVEETRPASLPPLDPFALESAPVVSEAPVSSDVPNDYPGLLSSLDRHARLGGSPSGSPVEASALAGGLSGSESGAAGPGAAGREGQGHGQGVHRGDGSGATQLYTPAPEYPTHARRRGIQGTVVVEISVLPDGTCTISRILESSGCEELDKAAQAAIRFWKYQPLEREGHPCSSLERVRFVFKLTG